MCGTNRASPGSALMTFAFCAGVTLAGCAPSRPDPELARQRQTIPSSRPAPPPAPPPRVERPAPDPYGTPVLPGPQPRSPQQMAAVQRVDRAKVLIAEGHYNRAIADLEKTLSLDATNPLVYFYLARAHHGLSHFQESLDFLEVAKSFMDGRRISRTEVLILQGDNFRGLDRLAEARQSYEEALAVDPRNETAKSRLRLLSQR